MPNKIDYVAPAHFHEYAGVHVYRAYKDDDWELPLTYWFTTDVDEDPVFEFDVRDVPQRLLERGLLAPDYTLDDDADFKTVLTAAIDHNLLKHPY
jgi:hypothetical protein